MITQEDELNEDAEPSLLTTSELDETRFPELRDLVLASEAEPTEIECRSYPGYPRFPLPRLRRRFRPSLDRALVERRSQQCLSLDFPDATTLSRLLRFAHGAIASHRRGPVPSAGGLQALELYFASWQPSWLPVGIYHYDRVGHYLSQINQSCDAEKWKVNIPSCRRLTGGALIWIIVGETLRVKAKYGLRGERFLLLEAGHLMQNLCLLSSSLGLVTVPQGTFYERWIAKELLLPRSDAVLYVAFAG